MEIRLLDPISTDVVILEIHVVNILQVIKVQVENNFFVLTLGIEIVHIKGFDLELTALVFVQEDHEQADFYFTVTAMAFNADVVMKDHNIQQIIHKNFFPHMQD